MRKTTMHNSEAHHEVHEPRELSEAELEMVSGGNVTTQDIRIVKYLDKATPILF